ncbi:MAG: ferritin family protein [Pseudomonadota bacterium]
MLTLAEALARSIEAERQGAAFYRMLAEIAREGDACRFLLDMAAEEEDHAAVLSALAEGRAYTPLDWERVLSLPDQQPDPDISAAEGELDLREAVELALEAERHSAYTYACVGAETEGETQELFTRLALTEQRHAEILERLLATLGEPARLDGIETA